MNTVKKGDAFEDQVYKMILKMLANDELMVNGKHCKVYQKKKYYSHQRKRDVIVDISVEYTMPDAPNPSLYLMIECKDLGHAVSVDEIEQFCHRTQQLAGLNVKAIFVTTSILQIAALNVAISNGIWVIRLRPDGQREVLSFRKERSSISTNSRDYINAQLALTSEAKSMLSSSQVGIGPGKVYHNFLEMLVDIISG